MSRCEQIRRYLKGQSEPRSASEIATGIGMPGDIRVSHTLGVMSREGTISKVGAGKKLVYAFVRDATQRATGEQAAINKAEYEARRNAERKAKRAAQATKSPPLLLKPVPVRTRAETVEEFLARGGVLALRMGRASAAKWRCVFPIGT